MKIFAKVFSLIMLAASISGCTDKGCFVFTGTPMQTSTIAVPATINNFPYDTGVSAVNGQLLRISVDTNSLRESVKSYKVMVRFDPRFPNPITYMATKNNATGQFIADWVDLNNTITANIASYNHGTIDYDAIRTTRLRSIQAYAAYATRNLIPVGNGNIIHFRNISSGEFYSNIANSPGDLTGIYNPSGVLDATSVITYSGEFEDNQAEYFNYPLGLQFMRDFGYDFNDGNSNATTTPVDFSQSYLGLPPNVDYWQMGTCGGPFSAPGRPCRIAVSGSYNNPNLYGIQINVSGQIAKAWDRSFVYAPLPLGATAQVTEPAFIYSAAAQSDGYLNFSSPYNTVNQFTHYGAASPKYIQYFTNINSTNFVLPDEPYFTDPNGMNYALNTILFGRYFFEIMIGNGNSQVPENLLQDITYSYYIGNVQVPAGQIQDGFLEIVAPRDGRVYVSLNNPNADITGNVFFTTTAYQGVSWISKNLNDNLAKPLKTLLLNTTAVMFGEFTTQGSFVYFLNTCLTLYVIIYGFQFALGSVKVTAKDVTDRLTKVLVVSMLFSHNAWAFFNQYLFSYFLTLTDQFMNAVALATADPTNPFGFIDPILTEYFSPQLWFIIGNYILFFGYGYILPAVLIIVGIINFMKALIEIFFGYLTAYIGLCVMIALAPLFITAYLFEYTKPIFNNWISVMVGYVLQPVLVLIFLLFINQLTSDILMKGLTQVCWQNVYQLNFTWDLGIDITIPLWMFQGYAPCLLTDPTVTNQQCLGIPYTGISLVQIFRVSALFYCLMKLAKEVVTLSKTVADRLTMSGGGPVGAVSGGGATDIVANTMGAVGKRFNDAYGEIRDDAANRMRIRFRKGVSKGLDRIFNTGGGKAGAGKPLQGGAEDHGKFRASSQKPSTTNITVSKTNVSGVAEPVTTSDGFKQSAHTRVPKGGMDGILAAARAKKAAGLAPAAKDGTVTVQNPLHAAGKPSGAGVGSTGRSSVVGAKPSVDSMIQAGSGARKAAGKFGGTASRTSISGSAASITSATHPSGTPLDSYRSGAASKFISKARTSVSGGAVSTGAQSGSAASITSAAHPSGTPLDSYRSSAAGKFVSKARANVSGGAATIEAPPTGAQPKGTLPKPKLEQVAGQAASLTRQPVAPPKPPTSQLAGMTHDLHKPAVPTEAELRQHSETARNSAALAKSAIESRRKAEAEEKAAHAAIRTAAPHEREAAEKRADEATQRTMAALQHESHAEMQAAQHEATATMAKAAVHLASPEGRAEMAEAQAHSAAARAELAADRQQLRDDVVANIAHRASLEGQAERAEAQAQRAADRAEAQALSAAARAELAADRAELARTNELLRRNPSPASPPKKDPKP